MLFQKNLHTLTMLFGLYASTAFAASITPSETYFQDANVLAFYTAIAKGESDSVIQFLRTNPSLINVCEIGKMTPLMTAALFNRKQVTKLLIGHILHHFKKDETSPLNAQDQWGNTALHRAAEDGFFTIVSELLKAGASPFILNHDEKDPADLADKKKHATIAQLIRQYIFLYLASDSEESETGPESNK